MKYIVYLLLPSICLFSTCSKDNQSPSGDGLTKKSSYNITINSQSYDDLDVACRLSEWPTGSFLETKEIRLTVEFRTDSTKLDLLVKDMFVKGDEIPPEIPEISYPTKLKSSDSSKLCVKEPVGSNTFHHYCGGGSIGFINYDNGRIFVSNDDASGYVRITEFNYKKNTISGEFKGLLKSTKMFNGTAKEKRTVQGSFENIPFEPW